MQRVEPALTNELAKFSFVLLSLVRQGMELESFKIRVKLLDTRHKSKNEKLYISEQGPFMLLF